MMVTKLREMNERMKVYKEQGQGLLEFALVLPIMVLILVGLVDLGRAFFVVITLENAAREGARFGSLYPDNLAGARSAAVSEATGSGLSLSGGNVAVACIDAAADGKCDTLRPITVTVSFDFELILGWVLPDTVTLQRQAIMLVP